MYDRRAIVNLVEDAERRTPSCACGAPMIPVDADGALWLDCSERRRRDGHGLVARLASLDWMVPHRRELLVDAAEFEEALAA